jgi:hypothetical protein
MLNDIDFDFIDLGLPNLVWAKEKSKTHDKPVQLGSRLAPLAYEAAKKFPRWKFVGMLTWCFDDRWEIGKIVVYENREKIGTIGTNQTRQGLKYVIGNDRIAKGRKRGNHAETGDIKKALSLMAKSFGGKTTTEKLNEASAKLSGQLHSGNNQAQVQYNYAMQCLKHDLDNYILANLEEVIAAAISAGVKFSDISNIPQLKENYDTTRQIAKAYSTYKGLFILINGSDYLVQDGEEPSALTLSSELLPNNIKGKLGLLKLLEDNHFMKGVGYRLNASTFFVLKD